MIFILTQRRRDAEGAVGSGWDTRGRRAERGVQNNGSRDAAGETPAPPQYTSLCLSATLR